MEIPERFASMTVTQVLEDHPAIGEILREYRIDCVTCGSSSCLLRNTVAQHSFDPQRTNKIEDEINAYIRSLKI